MIATVYDTKHAIAMTADNGAEILMHIGLDTVQLEGAWNVGIKDYKAHVTISSKRIHEAMDDMDDTYYPKRHGFLRYAKTCFEHYGEYSHLMKLTVSIVTPLLLLVSFQIFVEKKVKHSVVIKHCTISL